MKNLAVGMACVMAGIGLGLGITAAAGTAGTTVCSANPCVIQASVNGVDGLRVVGSQGPLLDHPFIVEDWKGDPQFFVNVGQVATGDLPLCVTDPRFNMVACLSPGTWDAAAGQYRGAPFLELGGIKLTVRELVWLAAHAGRSAP